MSDASDSAFVISGPNAAAETWSQPERFVLEQNYPNPFNPSTTIGFKIRDYGFVTLKVYDVLGREVATLVKEEKKPGTYEVTWDATAVPSGTYLYRLTTGTGSQTRKLLLIR